MQIFGSFQLLPSPQASAGALQPPSAETSLPFQRVLLGRIYNSSMPTLSCLAHVYPQERYTFGLLFTQFPSAILSPVSSVTTGVMYQVLQMASLKFLSVGLR